MHYRNKRILLTGHRGFIGSKLYKQLINLGAKVMTYDNRTQGLPLINRLDYVFHFGSPSSQVLFKRNMAYCVGTTIDSFWEMAKLAQRHNARLIYPSTGLCSTNHLNAYARTKKLLEEIHQSHGLNALGLRIFATYGPGEEHKALYASVPTIFSTDVIEGRNPQIYGNGTQSRDFIYIDDVIKAILVLAEHAVEPIIEVGSGETTSFSALYNSYIQVQATIPTLKPIYVDKPNFYIEKTKADTDTMNKYYVPETDLSTGIRQLFNHLMRVHESNSNNHNQFSNTSIA